MRVFLDSNVLVSAFGTRGLCTDVLRLVMAEHELVTGEVVLEEVSRVLSTKFKLPADVVDEVIRTLRDYPVEPKPTEVSPVHVRDPDDAWVLASALCAGAEILVTGDPDLLEIASEVTELRIVKPRDFWELHRSARG